VSRSRIARIEKQVWPGGKTAAGLDAAYAALFAFSHPGNPDHLSAFLDQYAADGEPIPLAVPARLREFITLSLAAQAEDVAPPPPSFLPHADMASLNVDDGIAAIMLQYRGVAWHVGHAAECCGFDRGRCRQLVYFADRVRDVLTYWIHGRHDHPCLRSRPMIEAELDAYVGDPSAYPAGICTGCGDLLPLSAARYVDSVWRRRIAHLVACPGCGCKEFRVEDVAFCDRDDPAVFRAKWEAQHGRPAQQARPSEV
jgi:hypothetical protein